ncbi:NUDIX hydrolase [Streptomyces sp. WMMC1477]|uniref:NUDIX hydrolase n=1 Tax=Streptomyces sp. WMMC1477 TaxID=3015155 RepID=UPI0022B67EF1|nr:NUDIX hydrolase [Streptomyces sp. WMMC1477]MCZ7431954.1 NUDIX hydrolase [Streptomyces sp. WMMC1477]
MHPSTPDAARVIRAAGCVLWRPDPYAFVLVHRPKWADWSHPKGKLHTGESAAEAARREVLEETGMTCVLGARLPTLTYEVAGRPKTVDYWVAQAVAGSFVPSREVDRVVWLPPGRARLLLTHPRDRDLLDAAVTALGR